MKLGLVQRHVGAAAVAVLALAAAAGPARAADSADRNPMIFVHGYSGSGAQFESQKLRFVENGYPDSYVRVIEYDSLPATPVPGATGLNPAGIRAIEQELFPRLDAQVAQLEADSHRPKVDLLAHSLGTTLMHDYLNSDPARAANVGHYVNIDGRTSDSPPGGVPTLALWGSIGPLSPAGRSIGGATNVTLPNTTHVQAATSAESFAATYRFFTGAAPATTDIRPQTGDITLSGKALNFPQNDGLQGATVQVWPIDDATGQRTSSAPIAGYAIDGSGDWGPVTVRAGRRYELTIVRPPAPAHHFYYEPFLRDDHLVRLLESDALRSAAGAPSTRSVGMVVIRYKELLGDQGPLNDKLTFNGLDVCTETICPIQQLVNAVFAYDRQDDQQSDTSTRDPSYSRITFLTGVDAYMPAQAPPTGKVTVTLRSRGGGPERSVVFPNFPASSDVESVQLNDFEPAGATCARRDRFAFRIHQPRGGRIVQVDAYIDGRRVKRVRGTRVGRLTVRRPAGKDDFRLVIVARASNGQRTVSVRRFHRCGKTRPITRVHRPPRHHHG
jgi:hypothetical protein